MEESHGNPNAQRLYAAACGLLLGETVLSLTASAFDGAWRIFFRVLAYLAPVAVYAFFLAPCFGIRPARPPQRAGARAVLPLFPLFLCAVLFVSSLTGWVLSLCRLSVGGGSSSAGSFFRVLLLDCLLPAVLEELLFRYAILSLLRAADERHAVWMCALLFAMLHGNLYQIPYAFVGGLFLSLAAIRGGSVLFPLLFHFGNNLLSVTLERLPLVAGMPLGMVLTVFCIFLVCAAAAWGALTLYRRGELPSPPPQDGWQRVLFSPLLLYLLLMLFYTALSLGGVI